MALAKTPPLLYPIRGGHSGPFGSGGAGFASNTLSVATDVLHQTGRVRWADNGDHVCSKVHIVSGTVTSIGPASILRVGFQNLSASAPRGNGTFTNFGDLTAADVVAQAKLVVTLASQKSLANGELACVSVQITTFTTGDNLRINSAGHPNVPQMPVVFLNTAPQSGVPNVLLEANDGTFGIFEGGDFFSGVDNDETWDNTAGQSERGVSLRVPFLCKVNGIWAGGFRLDAATGAVTVRVYSDVLSTPTTLLTITPASNEICGAPSSQRFWMLPLTEQTLVPGIDYGITIQPTTDINVYVGELIHHTAGYASALAGGTDYKRIQRASGAFTVDATRTLQLGFVISALEDGTATGGGLLTHPGMGGGMRG